MNNSSYKIVTFLIVISIVFGACSKLRDEDKNPVSGEVEVHPDGFTNTSSANFHGNAVKNINWDLTQCQKCHGSDYSGGTSGKSCNYCHQGGPESCNTCHGNSRNAAPPNDVNGNSLTSVITVGAHQAHLIGGVMSDGINCVECHKVPKTFSDAGHIDNLTALEIYFTDSLANVKTLGMNKANMSASLISNGQDIQCANTYCHGNFTNGNNYTPKWTKGQSEAKCGSCHSMPPKAPHVQLQPCFACHTQTVDANLNIIDKTKHINGKLEVYGTVRTNW